MEIIAMYMPDLKFPACDGNFKFKYNVTNKNFEMEIDNDFSYSFDTIIDDDDWIFFKVDKEDNETKLVTQISRQETKKLILICDLMLNKNA